MEIPLRHSTPYPISCFFFIVGGQGCLCDTTYGFCEQPVGCCNSSCRPASSFGCGCSHRHDPPPASASSSASWGISLPGHARATPSGTCTLKRRPNNTKTSVLGLAADNNVCPLINTKQESPDTLPAIRHRALYLLTEVTKGSLCSRQCPA